MGHAMHRVRREEKRRNREEEGGEGRGGEEDPGGGGGDDGREEDKKGGKEVAEQGEKESGGRVRLRGALLQTYVLSILIRSIMEVCPTGLVRECGKIKETAVWMKWGSPRAMHA